jgi:hypothetical protein
MLISPTCSREERRQKVSRGRRPPACGWLVKNKQRGRERRRRLVGTHLILDDSHPPEALLPQNVVEQGGLAGSQEARDLRGRVGRGTC